MIRTFILSLFILPSLAFSHGGGLDKNCGHIDKKIDKYHCHKEPCYSNQNKAERATWEAVTSDRAMSFLYNKSGWAGLSYHQTSAMFRPAYGVPPNQGVRCEYLDMWENALSKYPGLKMNAGEKLIFEVSWVPVRAEISTHQPKLSMIVGSWQSRPRSEIHDQFSPDKPS